MKWILILYLNSYSDQMHSIEFDSEGACRNAIVATKEAEDEVTVGVSLIGARCVPKGGRP